MELEECFVKYKSITLTIMEAIKSENYENLDELFGQRQLILDNIKELNGSKEEMKKIYLQCNIEQLEKSLEEEIKKRKDEILVKIKENQKRKTAMNGYNNLQSRAVFLSKEF
ncbi:hypothetical protein CDLVIII_5016 [Clostridium sp. DL-VIII]|uniref:flagellar protein FliT n=1 Tax=Clostridium sp. DL-VIII TaxID=641107 RepID=UPI00023B063C|nr:flagellar protein FliT [Clostridium sp. DL-VIII]EHJ01507.1 hypothetical protein CDLVIII_5016 [Clostridium sp. DL-VIII]